MHEHAHVALALVHDLGHFRDREIGDHAEQHGFGLIGGEAADQCQCALERFGPFGLLRGGFDLRRPSRQRPLGAVLPILTPAHGSDVVDPASGGDREQPAPKIRLAALETVQAGGDLEPHRRRQIVGVRHAFAPEVSEEQMLVGAPQHPECFAVAALRASDHLLHGL